MAVTGLSMGLGSYYATVQRRVVLTRCSEIVIEKGMPPKKLTRKEVLQSLEIGDRIFCKDNAEYEGIRRTLYSLNMKYRSQKIRRPDLAGYGFYIWRIE